MGNPINEKVGAWLLVTGNNQNKLADAIGITQPTLASRLDGTSKWKWDEVLALADLFDVSLNDLAGKREGD